MYSPTQDLMTGIRRAFPAQQFPWDDYFPTMGTVDLLSGSKGVIAAKSFFIRRAPFGGAYALAGGITEMLRGIMDLRFDDPDFRAGMKEMGHNQQYIDWLSHREHLRLKVYSPLEGQCFFPSEPIISFVGPLPDIRLVEGIMTEAINPGSLFLTKWHRFIRTIRPGLGMEFARRRAQNHLRTSLYAALGGCTRSSNAEIRRFFDILISGTMGHEWMQRFGDIATAFDVWLTHMPNKPIGLVDTKSCMTHDFPLWLDAVYAHREQIKAANPAIWGWRDDSDDLARLAIDQYIDFFRHPLSQDPWFVERMRIFLTGDLDEYAAQSIIQQIRAQAGAAGLNAEDIIRRIIWAAGTKPGNCWDQPALGGVAKLMEVIEHGRPLACIKLALDHEGKPGDKTSIPGLNYSALVLNQRGNPEYVLVYPAHRYAIRSNEGGWLYDNERGEELRTLSGFFPNGVNEITLSDYTLIPQQRLVFDSLEGDGLTEAWDNPTIDSVRKRVWASTDQLHWSMTRLDKPETMRALLTPDLYDLRQQMIAQGALRSDQLQPAA